VHLARLRLRDFRNYAKLDATFSPGLHLVLGDNAQGKTNLLEAAYLVATLRSFRGVGGAQLIRQGQKGYFIGAAVVGQTEHAVKIYWSPSERRLELDQRPVRRLTDYLGTLRAVVFCTEDLLLVKGSGRVRRRFLDLLLSQTRPGYLVTLQRYTQALRARNALLRQSPADPVQLDGFSRELASLGQALIQWRQELSPVIAPLAQAAFARITRSTETLTLDYVPSVRGDFLVELAQSRRREQTYRTTLVGPHRDELRLRIDDRLAAQFASEGQKRSLAIALKIAQADYLAECHGSPPLLLIDDVMGELDAHRRSALVPLLDRSREARGQVFMTCTEENWPGDLVRSAQRWRVRSGALERLTA